MDCFPSWHEVRISEDEEVVSMSQILKFPREVSQTQRRLQKREARRFALSLSVLSVAVVALTLSENLNNRMRPTYIVAGSPEHISQINRAIASAQPFDIVEDIQAENRLATKISQLDRRPASLGQAPSALDQLRYGELAGKYRIAENSSHVREIEYVDSDDVSDRPILVKDRQAFLQANKAVMAVPFSSTKVQSVSEQKEVFELLDQSGRLVGQADFTFDDSGRLLSMKVQPNNF